MIKKKSPDVPNLRVPIGEKAKVTSDDHQSPRRRRNVGRKVTGRGRRNRVTEEKK